MTFKEPTSTLLTSTQMSGEQRKQITSSTKADSAPAVHTECRSHSAEQAAWGSDLPGRLEISGDDLVISNVPDQALQALQIQKNRPRVFTFSCSDSSHFFVDRKHFECLWDLKTQDLGGWMLSPARRLRQPHGRSQRSLTFTKSAKGRRCNRNHLNHHHYMCIIDRVSFIVV